jgi:hypothetical protein
MKIIDVDPRTLVRLPTANPNVMEPHVFEALCKGIQTDGFLQPILVVEEGDDVVLIDGEHRSQAAVAVGLGSVPAVVAPDRSRAEVLRIALNRMRGELDLSEVTRQMQLLLDTGFTEDDLALTGFAGWEIDAMLQTLGDDDELEGVDTTPIAPPKPKTYAITLRFDTESARARIREALEDLGEGNMLEGIEAALDTAAPDWRD